MSQQNILTTDRFAVSTWSLHRTLGRLSPYGPEALTLLQPNLAIPIHWGTLHPLGMGWWAPRFLSMPPYLFAHHAQSVAPEVQIQIVEPGHTFAHSIKAGGLQNRV